MFRSDWSPILEVKFGNDPLKKKLFRSALKSSHPGKFAKFQGNYHTVCTFSLIFFKKKLFFFKAAIEIYYLFVAFENKFYYSVFLTFREAVKMAKPIF